MHSNYITSSRIKYTTVLVALFLAVLFSSCDTISIGYSVVGDSALTGKKIDSILCGAGSPACGTGTSLSELATQYNVKASFALSIFRNESSYGKAGMALSTKSLGNIRCYGYSWCIGGFRAYHSWYSGYAAFFSLISSLYIKEWKLTTVDQIMNKYAPSSSNDTSSYIQHIEGDMDKWEV